MGKGDNYGVCKKYLKQAEFENKAEYIKDGSVCPFCGSFINAPIVTGPNTTKLRHHHNRKTGADTVRQQVKCSACGSLWIDIYKLSDIQIVKDTKGEGY